jgi:hypothetical protein
MFCRATTGTCPSSCRLDSATTPDGEGGEGDTPTGAAPGAVSSNSVRNPALVPFIEDCFFGILSCVQQGDQIISTCQTCNVGSYKITSTIRNDSTSASLIVTACARQTDYLLPSGANPESVSLRNDAAPIGSCSGMRYCNGNGCCSANTRCNCFRDDLAGHYGGSSCGGCDPRYSRDPVDELCTVLIPAFLFRLSNLLGTRPSALVAPVLVVAAFVSLFSFLVRTRWPSDQQRYVVPAGVALVDPVSGFSVGPNARFYIPPRPTASRGIVNQRMIQKQKQVLKTF